MSPHPADFFPTYQPYSHLRSSNSPGPSPSKDMQHHPVMAQFSQQWDPPYPSKYDYSHPFPISECADCNADCTEPACSTVNELTSQCTDQCVVITCSDPNHGNLNCTDGHSYCNLVCDGAPQCADCKGFDTLLQCCEEYHPCYVDETRPQDPPQPLPQHTIESHYQWDALTTTHCDCGYPERTKTPVTAHPAFLSQVTAPTDFSPALVGDNSPYSPYSLPSPNTPYAQSLQPFPSDPQDQPMDIQVVQQSPPPESQPPQQYIPPSPSFSAAPFVCMWGNCQEQFSSPQALVGHVNLTHLRNPADPGCSTKCDHPPGTHAHAQVVEETTRLPCLWRDCTEYLEPQLLSKSSDANLMDLIQSTLASHLLQDHLKLYGSPDHIFLSSASEDDRIFAELAAASSQQEEAQPSPALHQPHQNHDVSDGNGAVDLTPSSVPVEKVQEEILELGVHQQFDVLTTSPPTTATTTTTTISSPATSVEEIPPPGTSGAHVCRWEGCTMAFETCQDLTNHMSIAHVGSGKPQYDCLWEGCSRNGDKGFSSKQKISRHLQSHTGYRPFQCPECLQNFSESATLQQHIRRHTQEKPYKCDFPGCGKSFAITGALTIHKRIHNGLKPFKCTYCGRGFAESSNLSKHLRTHTGERPYICGEPSCRKAFARPDQLTRHMAVHRKKAVATTAVV